MNASTTAKPFADGSGGRHSYGLLIVLMLAQIGTSCDNGAMSVAVTSLMAGLDASLADIQIANTVYALVAGAFMLAGGMVGILFGWRRTLRIGLACAIAGEACAVLSPSIIVLTWVGRTFVGLGASLIIPSVLGMVPALYEGRRRAIAFSGIAGAAALATIAPLPFGMIVDGFGFRVTFATLAAYFIVVLACTAALPAVRTEARGLRLDPGGIALAVSGVMVLLLGFSRLPTWGVIEPMAQAPFTVFGIAPSLPLIALGVALLVALAPYERHIENKTGFALIPRSYMVSPHVRAGLLAVFLPFFYLGAYLMLLMPYLQIVAGFSAMQAGLVSVLSTTPMFLCAIAIPKFAPHVSSRRIVRTGFVLIAVAFALMGLGVGSSAASPLLYVGVFVGGCGVGVVNSQANNAVASSVSGRDAQQSGGIQGAARNIGLAVGTAMAGTVLLLSLSGNLSSTLDAVGLFGSDRAIVVEQASSLIGDRDFGGTLEALGLDPASASLLKSAHASAQGDAVRFTFLLLGGLSALCLIGTKNLTETAVRNQGETTEPLPNGTARCP